MKIYTYPDSVLRECAEPVENIDDDIQKLLDDMIETMHDAKGIGLAANQVGVLKRVIVFEKCPGEEVWGPEILINPEIVFSDGMITQEEACLSVVDFAADVARAAQVRVKGLDRNGKPIEIEGEGLKAVCLQHEIDHLDGILFIDHISSLKRSLYKRKMKKKLKESA